jgi:hypothetical protein
MHGVHLVQGLSEDWSEYQMLAQQRINTCANYHEKVADFRQQWTKKLDELEEKVNEDLNAMEASMQKKKKSAHRKKDLAGMQKLLQTMM